MPVNLKTLGSTDVKIPEVGLGTWKYGGDAEALAAGIRRGARFIDTAEGYGTERVAGEAVRLSGERVFVATKVSGRHLGCDDVLRAADESLAKLGTDIIDLYQIHWPNPEFPMEGTMKAMQKLADTGIVRFVGVSNFSVSEFEEAQSLMEHTPIVSNQVLYNLNAREIESELLPFCEKNGVTVIAYTPLDSGRLCGNSAREGGKYEVLSRVAREAGKSESQTALNWCLCHENVVVIPKSESAARNEENCGASGWRLEKERFDLLSGAFGNEN